MKTLTAFLCLSFALLLSFANNSHAEGKYDGTWQGTGTLDCETGSYSATGFRAEELLPLIEITEGHLSGTNVGKNGTYEFQGSIDNSGRLHGGYITGFRAAPIIKIKGTFSGERARLVYEGETSKVFVKCRGKMTLTRASSGDPPALAMAEDASQTAEYDRLKRRKTVTASKSTSSGSVVKYCVSNRLLTYQRPSHSNCVPGREITKAEYDRLKGKTVEERRKAVSLQTLPVDKREAESREQERIAREKREQERIAREQQDVERIARERAALPELDVLDAPYVALKNINVRERPDVESTRVATLSKGSEVTALGKIKDKNWYLVSRDGKRLGYVFGTLLAELGTEPETRVAAALELTPAIKAPENKDAVAVIIGNRNYEGDIPKVDYAHNDADAIRTFVTDLLGHDPDNIIDLRDATKAKIEATFGNERSHQGKLWSYLDAKGGSDVVIYYSGHGVPGQKDQRGYLLPTDADPDHPEINGYPLDVLYANLGKLEARSITVLLDACFSGGSHRGTLIRSASPILVTAREIHEGSGKVVVLTAASGDQLASWDEKAKHGLFTRYFLEGAYGAADTDGNRKIELEEIKAYLDRTMTRRARRDFLREQEAWISGAPDTVLVQLGSQQN